MKCLASTPRFKDKKMKKEIVNDALESVFVMSTYVLITQFNMSVEKTKKILEKVEYYSLIMIDEEECLSLQDYEEILKEEYNFVLDLSKIKTETAESKGKFVKNNALKNSLDYVLTIVAYILLDKVGLSPKRVQTIMTRIIFYTNVGIKNEAEVSRLKELLKNEYDCDFGFNRR